MGVSSVVVFVDLCSARRLPNLDERCEPHAPPVKEGNPVSEASTGTKVFTGGDR